MKQKQLITIFTLLLLFFLPALGETIFLAPFAENEIVEFQKQYQTRLYHLWASDTGVTFIDKRVVDKAQDALFGSEKMIMNDKLAKHLISRGIEESIIAIPTVLDFRYEPHRSGVAFIMGEVHGILKVRYSFYDLKSGKELYVTEVDAKTKLSKGILFWRSLDKYVTLTAADKEKMNETLLEQSVHGSYEALQHLLKTKPKTATETKDDEDEFEVIE